MYKSILCVLTGSLNPYLSPFKSYKVDYMLLLLHKIELIEFNYEVRGIREPF